MAAKKNDEQTITIVLKGPDPKKLSLAEKVARTDDLSRAGHLIRDSVEEHKVAPKATATGSALKGFWQAIMENGQKAVRLEKHLDEFADPVHFSRVGGKAVALLPARLDEALRDLSGVYTGLVAAWQRYLNARIVWKEKIQFGFTTIPSAPVGTDAALKKWHESAKEAAKKAGAKYAAILQEILDAVAATSRQLEDEAEAVKELVARVQAAEEERLGALLVRLPKDHPNRAPAKKLLDGMEAGRLYLRQFNDAPSQYFFKWRDRWELPRRKVEPLLAGA